MTPYERYRAMIDGTPKEHVPRIPILMHFAARYAGVSYGDFAEHHATLVAANLKIASDFGSDILDVMSDPYREMVDWGGQVEYLPDAVPRCVRAPLAEAKDLRGLVKPRIVAGTRMANAIQAIQAYKESQRQHYGITGWVEGPAAEAGVLRGHEAFLIDLMTDEVYAGELMDRCVDVAISFAQAQIQAGADTIGVGDAIVSQMSPDLAGRMVQPRQARLVDAIHEMGGLVRLHICGKIDHLMEIIKSLHVDILDCDWMVDMARARDVLGTDVTLGGNLDPVNAVMKGTPESIRDDLQRVYEAVGNPWLVNAGCEIPADTPHENLKALCEPIPVI